MQGVINGECYKVVVIKPPSIKFWFNDFIRSYLKELDSEILKQ